MHTAINPFQFVTNKKTLIKLQHVGSKEHMYHKHHEVIMLAYLLLGCHEHTFSDIIDNNIIFVLTLSFILIEPTTDEKNDPEIRFGRKIEEGCARASLHPHINNNNIII